MDIRQTLFGGAMAVFVAACSGEAGFPETLNDDWSGGNTAVYEVRFSAGGRLTINGACSGAYELSAIDDEMSVATLETDLIDCPGVMNGFVTDATVEVDGDTLMISGPVLNGTYVRGKSEEETSSAVSGNSASNEDLLEDTDTLPMELLSDDDCIRLGGEIEQLAGVNITTVSRLKLSDFSIDAGALGSCDYEYSEGEFGVSLSRGSRTRDSSIVIAEEFEGVGDSAVRIGRPGGDPTILSVQDGGLKMTLSYPKDMWEISEALRFMDSKI